MSLVDQHEEADRILAAQHRAGIRSVRVADGVLEQLAERAHLDVTWGDPDADGFYEPTFSERRGGSVNTDPFPRDQWREDERRGGSV